MANMVATCCQAQIAWPLEEFEVLFVPDDTRSGRWRHEMRKGDEDDEDDDPRPYPEILDEGVDLTKDDEHWGPDTAEGGGGGHPPGSPHTHASGVEAGHLEGPDEGWA